MIERHLSELSYVFRKEILNPYVDIEFREFVTLEEARKLARLQFNYLERQIRAANSIIDGLVLEFDDRTELQGFIDICIIQRVKLARTYGFRI